MSVNIEREKAKKRIAALLNKTIDNGATEHEAIIASEKAAELMEFYDIEYGELEYKEKNIVVGKERIKTYARMILLNGVGIAKLCQCRCWIDSKFDGSQYMTFCGFASDVENATNLFNYLQEVAEKSIETFKNSKEFANYKAHGGHGKKLTSSYIGGFNNSLYNRMVELAAERQQKLDTATGTSLVVLKEADIDSHMQGLGLNLRRRTVKRSIHHGAYDKGAREGKKVSLSGQVAGGSNTKALGNG